jgi:hypothetical protein
MTGKPRFIIESIELDSWSAVVRDDGNHSIVGSATTNALQPGPGPGDLVWERSCEGGLPALRATWGTGHFLILPLSSVMFGLFFALPDRDQPLAVGSVEGLKYAAPSHKPPINSSTAAETDATGTCGAWDFLMRPPPTSKPTPQSEPEFVPVWFRNDYKNR